jgi:hypothetical protein
MRNQFNRIIFDVRGSISILIFGLFIVLLSTAVILTNISSVYLAKRSLSIATEAAAQRGVKNLDTESYYSGEYNALQLAKNIVMGTQGDPGIPIDCRAGYLDAEVVINDWHRTNSSRVNLEQLQIDDFQCDGYQVYIETSAIARIPIKLPFIHLTDVRISTRAGAYGERAKTNNYYGLDIG